MPNQTNPSQRRPVLVIGAGPIGLTAALVLRRYGIPATILETEPFGRVRPGSRAIFIHNATLKLLEEISPDLGFTMAGQGIVWPVKRTFWRGREVYMRKYDSPAPGTLPPFTSLPQVQIESILYQACLNAGVEFVWETPVTAVTTDDNEVRVQTESGHEWTAEYLIGADGSRSVVRKSVGLEMEGTRSANNFLVVDVKEDEENPLPLERTFHYHHPGVNDRNVLFVPFAGGWRVDLQLFEGDDPEAFGGVEGVKEWLPKVMDPKYADRITWVSTYQFLQVVAKDFTDAHRRVLLGGEAAHLFAPFGARGLNSGVPDVVSAAKAIHTAMNESRPAAARAAVSEFAKERRSAAVYNRDAAGIALHHLQGRSLGMGMKRYVAAAMESVSPRFGRWLDEGPYGPKSGPSSGSRY